MLGAGVGFTTLAAFVFWQLSGAALWVPLLIILLMLLIFWWGMTRNHIGEVRPAEEDVHPETEPEAPQEIPEAGEAGMVAEESPADRPTAYEPVPTAPPVAEGNVADDLERIEGIGPKISELLQDAGIISFAQLAEQDPAELEQLLRERGGITIADPTTWPEQAQLAAEGRWAELEQLQDELTAGRRADD